MMNKYAFIGIIIGILVVAAIAMVTNSQHYEPFTMDEEGCLHYNKDCYCLGVLLVMESYPAQYRCQGIDFCKDVDKVVCESE